VPEAGGERYGAKKMQSDCEFRRAMERGSLVVGNFNHDYRRRVSSFGLFSYVSSRYIAADENFVPVASNQAAILRPTSRMSASRSSVIR
jgi:hypothetical protein